MATSKNVPRAADYIQFPVIALANVKSKKKTLNVMNYINVQRNKKCTTFNKNVENTIYTLVLKCELNLHLHEDSSFWKLRECGE